MNTFAETESLLKVALLLSQNTVKQIAEVTGIKANTLYKWRTTDVHLSTQKADALLLYFTENEPQALLEAQAVIDVQLKLQNYLTSLTEQEVAQKAINYGNLNQWIKNVHHR